jgi:hypothetical protein
VKGVPIPKLDAQKRPTGKFRPIVLAPLEARIVQRAILNVLLEVENLQPFIRTPYSFGGLRAQREPGEGGLTGNGILSAVPAAIEAALAEIGRGSKFFASADIRSFFTRVPKPLVCGIVANAVHDDDFMSFFGDAMAVELVNMAALRDKASAFPSEEVGVAQGNSLSPLLGNIVLAEFDKVMNEGDCACLRYIDDFIVLAPTQRAANARMQKAIRMLAELGMELSPEKSSEKAKPVSDGFEFLGIEVCPGLIRPSRKAQQTLLDKVRELIEDGKRALVGLRNQKQIDREMSFLSVLRRVDGTVNGWGKHYWFCNDGQAFQALDEKIWRCVRTYLGCYSEVRGEIGDDCRPIALGLSQLRRMERRSLVYPKFA